jgi:hypothetical protein
MGAGRPPICHPSTDGIGKWPRRPSDGQTAMEPQKEIGLLWRESESTAPGAGQVYWGPDAFFFCFNRAEVQGLADNGNVRGVLRWSRQTSATSWVCTKAKLSRSKVGKRRQGRCSCHARTMRFLSTLISDFIYLWHVLRQQREKNSCRQ